MSYTDFVSKHVIKYGLSDMEHFRVLAIIQDYANKFQLTSATIDNAEIFTEIIVRRLKKLEVISWTISKIIKYAVDTGKQNYQIDLKTLIKTKEAHDLSLLYCEAICSLQ